MAISVDVSPPKTAQDAIVLPGNGKMRLSLGLVAMALLAGGYVISGLEVESLGAIAKQEETDAFLESKRQAILAEEEQKKLILSSDIRFKDFEQQLLDGYAMLLLENNPELAEQILAEKPPIQIEPETVAATATITWGKYSEDTVGETLLNIVKMKKSTIQEKFGFESVK